MPTACCDPQSWRRHQHVTAPPYQGWSTRLSVEWAPPRMHTPQHCPARALPTHAPRQPFTLCTHTPSPLSIHPTSPSPPSPPWVLCVCVCLIINLVDSRTSSVGIPPDPFSSSLPLRLPARRPPLPHPRIVSATTPRAGATPRPSCPPPCASTAACEAASSRARRTPRGRSTAPGRDGSCRRRCSWRGRACRRAWGAGGGPGPGGGGQGGKGMGGDRMVGLRGVRAESVGAGCVGCTETGSHGTVLVRHTHTCGAVALK